MTPTAVWSLALFAGYALLMMALERRSARPGGASFAAFAAGRAEHGPIVTGLVIAACLASTATFSINPGFVYKDGLAALLGFSLPVTAGVTLAFVVLGPRFRASSLDADGTPRALTLSQWVGARFESPLLRRLLSLLVLALFGYVILVIVGAAYVVAQMLGVGFAAACAIVVALVLVDTLRGGAGAHALVNAAQGAIMVGAALILGGRALVSLLADGGAPLARLASEEPGLFTFTRPGSPFFGSGLDAYVLPLAIGFALGCQPQILGKALFCRDRAATVRTGLAAGGFFLAISLGALAVGLAARADLGPGLAQDQVAATWIARSLPAPVAALVGIALIAAAVSTLDGLFLALGATVANDLAGASDASKLRVGRIATIAIACGALLLSLDPPKLVWVTGALGAYAVVAAACPAVVAGVLEAPRAGAAWLIAACAAGPALHVALYVAGVSRNPNVTGAAGIAAGLAIALAGHALARRPAPVAELQPATIGG